MNRTVLLESASKIPPVTDATLKELKLKGDKIIAEVNERMLSREDCLELIGGSKNADLMKDNHTNHFKFIVSILTQYDPEVLVDTVLWVFRVYKSRGFNDCYWIAQINTWIALYNENISDNSYKEISHLYNWLITNIPLFSAQS